MDPLNDRPRELDRRRDAQVVRAEPLDRTGRMAALNTELLVLDRRWALLAEVNRMERRGEVRKLRPDPVWNQREGEWQMRVVRLKPPAPAWRRPLLIAVGIATPLLTFLGLLWWVLTALAAVPLLTLLGGAFIGLMVLCAVGRRGKTIVIEQRVTIR